MAVTHLSNEKLGLARKAGLVDTKKLCFDTDNGGLKLSLAPCCRLALFCRLLLLTCGLFLLAGGPLLDLHRSLHAGDESLIGTKLLLGHTIIVHPLLKLVCEVSGVLFVDGYKGLLDRLHLLEDRNLVGGKLAILFLGNLAKTGYIVQRLLLGSFFLGCCGGCFLGVSHLALGFSDGSDGASHLLEKRFKVCGKGDLLLHFGRHAL